MDEIEDLDEAERAELEGMLRELPGVAEEAQGALLERLYALLDLRATRRTTREVEERARLLRDLSRG